jgi:hypothetical protein
MLGAAISDGESTQGRPRRRPESGCGGAIEEAPQRARTNAAGSFAARSALRASKLRTVLSCQLRRAVRTPRSFNDWAMVGLIDGCDHVRRQRPEHRHWHIIRPRTALANKRHRSRMAAQSAGIVN